MGVMQTKHELFFSRVFTFRALCLIILVHSLIGDKQMSLPNYTEAQVKALRDASPVTLAVAKQFATDWNKSVKSIVAKSVSMGAYKAAERAERKGAKPTKADLVAAIAKATDAESLAGLEKAPAVALSNLLAAIA